MILAAAACVAAGYSYIFNNDEQSTNRKYETVTVSSTIIDKYGVVKYVQHPRIRNSYSSTYYPLGKQQQKPTLLLINEYKLNQFKIPIDKNKIKIDNNKFKRELSIIFYWSLPLRTHLLQASARKTCIVENLNKFERHLIKISVGIQNGLNERIGITRVPSEIALSNYDQFSYDKYQQKQTFLLNNEDFDDISNSLLCNRMINNNITRISTLKKKKSDVDARENNQKRFCCATAFDPDQEKAMTNIILKNVNLCVENLSKVLNQSCTDNRTQVKTLQNSSACISLMNENKPKSSYQGDISNKIVHSQLFKKEENFKTGQCCLNNGNNNQKNCMEHSSDGIILHRGKHFGLTLGEPVRRQSDVNVSTESFHSIKELNKLLSKANCLLMQQYKIESIEDLIRLFLEQGQHDFCKLMINLFQVDPLIVEQLSLALVNWAKNLT